MTQFILRPTEPRDIEPLNDLYAELTGIRRTFAQFKWEWLDCPNGPAPSWVIVEALGGQVVGHHGVIPVLLSCAEATITAARTENTMVHPAFRAKLLYSAFEARILGKLLQEYEIIFTTAGKGAQSAVRHRLGYVTAGNWQTFTIAISPSYLTRRISCSALDAPAAWIRRLFTRQIPSNWTLAPTDDCDRVARLWQVSRKDFGLCAARDVEYLKWRLVNHPYHACQMFLIANDREDIGYVAWHQKEGPRCTIDVIVDDIFVRGNTESSYVEAFNLLARQWRPFPARILLRTLQLDTALHRALEAVTPLFARARQANGGAELLFRSTDIKPGLSWEATMLLAEGI